MSTNVGSSNANTLPVLTPVPQRAERSACSASSLPHLPAIAPAAEPLEPRRVSLPDEHQVKKSCCDGIGHPPSYGK